MILVDYYQIAISSMLTIGQQKVTESLLRHVILNDILSIKKQFGNKFGKLIIVSDTNQVKSWRREYFPHYKAGRQKARTEDSFDWNEFFNIVRKIYDELENNTPLYTIMVPRAEGDDVIAVITQVLSEPEFGIEPEPVLIISTDGDFIQLHRWPNVKQFSKIQNKMITADSTKNKKVNLVEHIIYGDATDGIPNVFSSNDAYVNENSSPVRMSVKRKQQVLEYLKNEKEFAEKEPLLYERWIRNKTLIDLSMIPADLVEQIINKFNLVINTPINIGGHIVLTYLMQNRCKNLIERIEDFF